MRRTGVLVAVLVVLVSGLAACGDDDGSDVRNVGGEDSGSASGSGSGSGVGSGSESGSGSVVACEPVGDASAADREVHVALDEWSVEPDAESVEAGTVTFEANNEGEEPHELVIVKGESADDLPTDDEGAVDESELPAGADIGEIEEFPAGDSCSGTFELDSGSYVLFCNIGASEHSHQPHFAEGMHTTFTVN